MPTQDTSQIKEKIIFAIKSNGPSLPAHIAQEVGTSLLFASAFLSELLSEKKLKISSMRVGSSPLYYIPGQETQLEKFSHHLKSKEKDAFEILKNKKILRDSEQDPAIRVALRAIKDFAIPLNKNEELYWKYLGTSEEIPKIENPKEEIKETTLEKEEKDEPKEEPPEKEVKIIKKKITRKKTSQNKNDKFFNKVKEYLQEKEIEISDIIGFSKDDLILKVKKDEKEFILVAYNKRSIKEEQILKAYKKALEYKLKYIILSLGEPLKKVSNFLEAIQSLHEIEKID